MKFNFNEEEINHIRICIEDDYNNGRRVQYENPKARLLLEEWNKVMKIDMSILEKIRKEFQEK